LAVQCIKGPCAKDLSPSVRKGQQVVAAAEVVTTMTAASATRTARSTTLCVELRLRQEGMNDGDEPPGSKQNHDPDRGEANARSAKISTARRWAHAAMRRPAE